MKRSEISQLIQDAPDFMESHQFHLPPFAHWSPETWRRMATTASGNAQQGPASSPGNTRWERCSI